MRISDWSSDVCSSDLFKTANDQFGHAAGDAVLVVLSERIKATLRKQDFAARIGGDEFVVIADPIDARRDADDLADRIRRGVADPIRLPGGETCHITGSIHVALYPADGGDGPPRPPAADPPLEADHGSAPCGDKG